MEDYPPLRSTNGVEGSSQLKIQDPNPESRPHLSYEEISAVNELQRLNLNGTSDHGRSNQNGSNRPGSKIQPDFDSEKAFPSLGAPSAAPKTAVGWGQGPALSTRSVGNNQKSTPLNSNQYTETLVLLLSSIHIGSVPPQYREKGPRQAGEKREEDPKTLPDVLRAIQRRHPTVSLESSTSRDRVTILFRTPYTLPRPISSTPPLIKAAHSLHPEERIIRARQELITRVTRKIEKVIMIPAPVKPFVIGQRGRILKEIIESTGANINLPPKGDRSTPGEALIAEGGQVEIGEDVEMIPITISGEVSAVLDAEDKIMGIVKERTNKVTVKISSIPTVLYPLLDGPSSKGSRLSELVLRNLIKELGIEQDDLNCNISVPSLSQTTTKNQSHICLAENESVDGINSIPSSESNTKKDLSITVSGDKSQVEFAVKLIESFYNELMNSTTKVEVEIPKKQHRLLDVQAIEEILAATGSLVILPSPLDPRERVVIRGEKMSNVQALGLLVTKANDLEIETLDLERMNSQIPNSSQYAAQLTTFLSTKAYQTKLKQIQEEAAKSGVKIYIPLLPFKTIEIMGDNREKIIRTKLILENYLKSSIKPSYFQSVEVDRLLHGYVAKKKNPKLKSLQEPKGIEIIIPREGDMTNTILLVAVKPIQGKDNQSNEQDTINALDRVKEEILKSVRDLAEISTVELEVDQKFHSHILGPNGTTLNAIIGEDKLVAIKIGPGDLIGVRGSKDEVLRVEKEIIRIAEEAKVTDTINSYSTEFEVDSKLVSHLVGKGGSTISKLRETLGVRVDFSDRSTEETASKKRKQTKSLVLIQGRKENVEEAKKRILAQAERLADEVTVSLPMIAGLDKRALVGKGGRYILRLQDVHMVFITMPRGPTSENGVSSSNENENIIIRGPKKGVDAVRKELVELMEYERENNNTISMKISTKSVARVLGKGGLNLEKIKQETDVQAIDIDKLEGPEDLSQVTLRGTKSAIQAAKKTISGIVQEVDEESVVEMKIEKNYHQSLIGKGGSRLRELVELAGCDEEAAKKIYFPRSTDPGSSNVVTIKGKKSAVPKIKEQLEKEIQRLKSLTTYGVRVPKASHAAVIGRGGINLKSLQSQHNVLIYTPGWKEWVTADTPVNQDELKDVDPSEIFKVLGPKEGCLAAIEELKSKAQIKERSDRAKSHKKTLIVPCKYHHLLFQNGRAIRELPRGVRIDYGSVKLPTILNVPNEDKLIRDVHTSRIDVDVDEGFQTAVVGWDVQELKSDLKDEVEIPWNITGLDQKEVEAVEKRFQDKLNDLISGSDKGENQVGFLKLMTGLMPKVIGRGGTGLRSLIEQSGALMVEVVGRTGSDTLKIIGNSQQIGRVKFLIEKEFDG
ncbi:hypothetical protein BY996DRAFT_4590552 [Phakopsora pachyrhizi]|uniref:K Homology domain-containing protein n=1 Tax=Phakopsora pachyrhizi TaxID=170000 RepID=A0AAV0AFD6_PHAPC|nr:hypothetical protein BY996DRAFT_4590552 [Phakopsora pachyrhizi]CAH7666831.1 hypothetical protein PPACK8108_LOCUS1188 [Phakopsora pachyrhizi]